MSVTPPPPPCLARILSPIRCVWFSYLEQLDRLEVVQWRSLANVQPSYTITRDGDRWRACEKINAVVANWARLLARVTGLTRNILDFGVFVQLYVAASESDRLATAAAVEATRGRGEGAKTQNKRNDRKPTTRRIHGIQVSDRGDHDDIIEY